MGEFKRCRNDVVVIGEVSSGLTLDHIRKNLKLHSFKIGVERYSGIVDEIPILISDITLKKTGISIEVGKKYKITGEFRSHNKWEETPMGMTSRLLLYVLVKDIEVYESSETYLAISNSIEAQGYVVKVTPVRETPLGKKIMEVIIAINRAGKKSSYIPCILWFPSEYLIKNLTTGKKVSFNGRIQSREYTKSIGIDEVEKKIAYEVSIQKLYIEDNEVNENEEVVK